MFNKKKCPNCKSNIKSSSNFCQDCGYPLNNKKKGDWGILGRNDLSNEPLKKSSFFDNLGQNLIDKMMKSAFNMVEKEMKREMKNPEGEMQVFINGKKVNPVGNKKIVQTFPVISKKNLKNISGLPKVEPVTEVKRMSDKIVYRLKIPGVSSIENLSIIRVENGFEIKAVSKGEVYFKSLPINLDMINYKLFKGNLVLEFYSEEM